MYKRSFIERIRKNNNGYTLTNLTFIKLMQTSILQINKINLAHKAEFIDCTKQFNIRDTEETESSFAGIIKSVKVGSQFVSTIVIIVIPNLTHSFTAFISLF